MRGLQGKVALVTGGATLIGEAVVRRLGACGARVAVLDIDGAGAARVAAGDPEHRLALACDLTDDAGLRDAVGQAQRRFGGIDLLVNLACSYVDNGFASPRREWAHALDVGAMTVFLASVGSAGRL